MSKLDISIKQKTRKKINDLNTIDTKYRLRVLAITDSQ